MLALLASAPAFATTTAPACEAIAPRPDRLNVTCVLGAGAQRLAFKARFSGSHDDTTASLRPTFEGRALTCEPGSKTELTGEEEGDVELVCRLSVATQDGAPRRLHVQLAWHHAQYTDFELVSE